MIKLNVLVEKQKIDILANAISNKSGEPVTMTLEEMVEAVDGIETVLVVTLSWDDDYFDVGEGAWVPNKTFAEIQSAHNQGKTIVVNTSADIADVQASGAFNTAFAYNVQEYNGINTIWYSYLYDANGVTSEEEAPSIYPNFDSPSVTYTPTESQQTEVITYDTSDDYNGIEEVSVTVNAIPSNYVGSGITRRTASDVYDEDEIVFIPPGLYTDNPTKYNYPLASIALVAEKGVVTNNSVTVTPNGDGHSEYGYFSGVFDSKTPVTVSASELVSGSQTITENGTFDVTNLASVLVDVASDAGYVWQDENGYVHLSNEESGGGGSVSVSKKQINFIDYDGTILYSYSASEWANVSTLPNNPSHSGLIAQGWNWTKNQIDAQLTAQPDAYIWVGQMYITESGDTEIDVSFDDEHLSPYLTVAVDGTVTVDWGDNTTTTVTGTSTSVLKYTLHEYAVAGDYTISIHVDNGTLAFYNNSSVKVALLSAYGTDSYRRYNREYSNCVFAIRIGSNTMIRTYAFSNCYALQSITIPDGITSIGNTAFSSCYTLQSITIPDGVTSIGGNVFSSCRSLQSITIPDGVTSIDDNAFYNCSTLLSITIPDGVTSINSYAFQNCYALQSITIPDGVTSINSYVFQLCYALQSITIPDGVTSIDSGAFSSCYTLQFITIPDGVTSIGNNAFSNCYTLQSITIPDGVISIGNNAFSNCYAVEEYHLFPTTPPTLGTNAFSGIVDGTIIYVPQGCLEAYQTATNWSTYASYMQEEA